MEHGQLLLLLQPPPLLLPPHLPHLRDQHELLGVRLRLQRHLLDLGLAQLRHHGRLVLCEKGQLLLTVQRLPAQGALLRLLLLPPPLLLLQELKKVLLLLLGRRRQWLGGKAGRRGARPGRLDQLLGRRGGRRGASRRGLGSGGQL
jgi:hypothetical protein